ncbi:MAG: GntR family transcriptional regulator [Verrucomicrobiota bacterium]
MEKSPEHELPKRKITQRERLVRALTEEILDGKYPIDRPMPSENQLCRRFSVSRVTVRLALDVLQNRGLIHRQHGRGTFVQPTYNKTFRSPAILMLDGVSIRCHACWQMLMGMEAEAQDNAGMITLLNQPPADWPAAAFSQIGGLVAREASLSKKDLAVLRQQNLSLFRLGSEFDYGASLRFGLDHAAARIIEKARKNRVRRMLFVTMDEDVVGETKSQRLHEEVEKQGNEMELETVTVSMKMPEALHQLGAFYDRIRPDAIFLTSEWLSPTAHTLFERRGIKPGQEIFFGMYLHQDWPAMLSHNLAVVRLPCFEVGRHIVQQLQDYSFRPETLPDIDLMPTFYGLLAEEA